MAAIGQIALFMLVVMAMAINHSSASTVWAPATDPYLGSPAAAMALLIAEGAPADRLDGLFAVVNRHQLGAEMIGDTCIERFLRPGEPIALMVGGHGVSRDLTVPDPWPTPLDPLVIDCWDHDGHHLLRPEVCGNWAYQPPPGVILPPGGPEIITQGEQWVGWAPDVGAWLPQGAALFPSGFGFMPGGAAVSGPAASPSGILGAAGLSAVVTAPAVSPSSALSPGVATPQPSAPQSSPAVVAPAHLEIAQSNGPPGGPTNSPISGAPPPPTLFETTPNAPKPVPEPWCAPLLTLACAAVIALRITMKRGRT